MASSIPDGATLWIASTYSAALTVSTITNANPGVATSTAHGLTNGAIGLVASGWANLNDRVVRISGSVTNAFNLENVDTSSTTRFPVGGSAGTFTPITAWTQITQVMEFASTGGDQQFANISFLEQDFDKQIPSTRNAQTINITLADDTSLTGYTAMKSAAEARSAKALKILLPNGGVLLYQGYVFLNESPMLEKGKLNSIRCGFALQSAPVRYTS
jgi:hypothetical protein